MAGGWCGCSRTGGCCGPAGDSGTRFSTRRSERGAGISVCGKRGEGLSHGRAGDGGVVGFRCLPIVHGSGGRVIRCGVRRCAGRSGERGVGGRCVLRGGGCMPVRGGDGERLRFAFCVAWFGVARCSGGWSPGTWSPGTWSPDACPGMGRRGRGSAARHALSCCCVRRCHAVLVGERHGCADGRVP